MKPAALEAKKAKAMEAQAERLEALVKVVTELCLKIEGLSAEVRQAKADEAEPVEEKPKAKNK